MYKPKNGPIVSTWPPTPIHVERLFVTTESPTMDQLVDAVAADFAEPSETDAEQVARWEAYKRSHPLS